MVVAALTVNYIDTVNDRYVIVVSSAVDQIIPVVNFNFIFSVPGINRDKVGRIGYLQGFRVRYIGEAIREEAETYSWEPDKNDPEVFTDVPQDGGDHAMDAASYATTHLRRLAIQNDDGDLPERS